MKSKTSCWRLKSRGQQGQFFSRIQGRILSLPLPAARGYSCLLPPSSKPAMQRLLFCVTSCLPLLTWTFIYLLVFGCAGPSLLCVGFLQARRAGATLSQRAGFSLQRPLWFRAEALECPALSVAVCGLSVGLQAPEHRLGSCGAWAYLLRGLWDLLGPGLEPVSSALAGGFPTTGPPGESSTSLLPLIRAFVITLGSPEQSRY